MKLSLYCQCARLWVIEDKIKMRNQGFVYIHDNEGNLITITPKNIQTYNQIARDQLISYINDPYSELELDIDNEKAFEILGV